MKATKKKAEKKSAENFVRKCLEIGKFAFEDIAKSTADTQGSVISRKQRLKTWFVLSLIFYIPLTAFSPATFP